MKHFTKTIFKYFLVILPFWFAGCEEDQVGTPDSEPRIAGVSELQTLPGSSVMLTAEISDPVGLKSLNLIYEAWDLQEAFAIEGKTTNYSLSYDIVVPGSEGEDTTHELVLSAENDNGVVTEFLISLHLNLDIEEPSITNNTTHGFAFLIDGSDAVLEFEVTDNVELSSLIITGSNISERKELNGQSYTYSKELDIQTSGLYIFEIEATDVEGNKTMENITIPAYESFDKMYLADVTSDEDLQSDLIGVPMILNGFESVDSLGKVFEALYYNEQANTEIRFLPSKTSFSPMTIGAASAGVLSVGTDVSVSPIVLTNIGYNKIIIDLRDLTYQVDTYQPEDTEYDKIVFHGSDGIMVNGESICCWNPAVSKALDKDPDNPYRFTGSLELFDADPATEETVGSFILGASTEEWEPFWRFDQEADPDAPVLGAGWNFNFGEEASGTYDVIFDSHLNRMTIIPND